MSLADIIHNIKNYKPLTVFQMVEINKMSNSDKIIIIEEYGIIVNYLMSVIELREK